MSPAPETAAPAAAPTWLGSLRQRSDALVAALCLGYLLLETVYVLRLPLVMDEFQGAAEVARLSDELPYRDFRPYKTVLGYYLQWPALRLAELAGLDLWGRLLAIKLATAAATAGVLAWAARRLAQRIDPAAVVLGLLLLVTTSTFLERSAALRVDMMTALFGLGSLVSLVDGRTRRAGLLAGLSFLVSQKGLYYAVAGGAALALDFVLAGLAGRDGAGARLRGGLEFAAACALPVALYFGGFALVSSGPTVGSVVVAKAGRIALDDFEGLHRFWLQTVTRNPAMYLAMAGGLVALAVARRAGDAGTRDRRLLGYGAVLVALCAWHKQPWPYFFVMLLPTGFVLASRGIEALLPWIAAPPAARLRVAAAAFAIVGLAWPLSRVPDVLARDSRAQRTTVDLALGVLAPGDHYVGGLAFLYPRAHVPGLSWLDASRLAALDAAAPSDLDALTRRIEQDRPRIVIWNYRIARLPEPLLGELRRRYAPLFGNLLIYSPVLHPSEPLEPWFPGRYALSGPPGGSVLLDGRPLAVGEERELGTGPYRVEAPDGYRLHLVPDDIEQRLAHVDPALAPPQPLFVDPYGY